VTTAEPYLASSITFVAIVIIFDFLYIITFIVFVTSQSLPK
jgi:hypothetical protein